MVNTYRWAGTSATSFEMTRAPLRQHSIDIQSSRHAGQHTECFSDEILILVGIVERGSWLKQDAPVGNRPELSS